MMCRRLYHPSRRRSGASRAALVEVCCWAGVTPPHAYGVLILRAYQLIREQRLSQPLERVFPFFAEARNLESITPPWLHFRIVNLGDMLMRQGTAIDYHLRLHGIPFLWQSMIAEWEPPVRFVDVQTKGPYRLWRHEHRLEPGNGATIMRDTVTYAVWGSLLIQPVFIGPALERIFEYRRMRIAHIFEGTAGPPAGHRRWGISSRA